MTRRGRPRHPDILTPREWEVLALLREARTNEEIASRLGISLSTARYHVAEILGKLGVGSREDAAAWQPEPPSTNGRVGLVALARRASSFSIAARATAAALLVVATVAVLLLAWGVTRSSGSATTQDTRGSAWAIDAQDYGAPSVIAFDLAAHTATRLPVTQPLSYAEWAGGEAFVARSSAGAVFGPWQLVGVDGAVAREVAPADASVDANADGRHAIVVRSGRASIEDLTTGESGTIDENNVSDARFSPDGSRIAYRFTGGSDQDDQVHDFVNVMVAPCGSLDQPVAGQCTGANSIAFQREADGFLNMGLGAWSPDGHSLLLSREAGCETETAGCKRHVVFEVYGTVLSDDVQWHDYEGRLASADWAGPGRLLVRFADGAAGDPPYPDARQLLVTLGGAKHTVPDSVRSSCCTSYSFSPDGRYAVAFVGADAGERCALFDTQSEPGPDEQNLEPPGFPWKELASIHPVPADANYGFCSYVSWPGDGSRAIVSRTGN